MNKKKIEMIKDLAAALRAEADAGGPGLAPEAEATRCGVECRGAGRGLGGAREIWATGPSGPAAVAA